MPDPSGCSPLGQLGKLPRELRDQVYRWHITNVTRRYSCRHWKWLSSFHWDRRRWTATQCDCPFSILNSSSVIRRETLCALRTWGHFCFDEVSIFSEKKRDIPYVDFISNVRFRYNFVDYGYGRDSDFLAYTPAGRLSLFTGNDTLRSTCDIDLYNSGPDMARLVDSPLGKTISQLMGFKTVRLWFDDDVFSGRFDAVGSSAERTFADLTAKVASAFETTLGPSIMSGISDTGSMRDATFHPQTFLVSKNSEIVSGPLENVKEPALRTSMSE